jgi:hypothetical protein
MHETKSSAVVGESPNLRRGRMKILLRAEESEDRVALLEDAVPPACKGPPLHHHGWDEAFYVLASELTFQLADRS